MHAGAVVTHFNCTEGPLCAGDIVECNCSTSSGTMHWQIISNQASKPVVAIISDATCFVEEEGYTFTCDNESLNTSQLSFNLNHSETVHIECSNGNELDNQSTTITDAG